MNPRHAEFVRQYLIDLDISKAAIRAGYKGKTVRKTGWQIFHRPEVQEAIAKAMQERSQRTQITADRVLQELACIAFFDPRRLLKDDGTPIPVSELDAETAAALAGMDVMEEYEGTGKDRVFVGYTKKVKVADKVGALGLAMRHLGMLNDKLQLSGGVQVIVKDYTGRKANADD